MTRSQWIVTICLSALLAPISAASQALGADAPDAAALRKAIDSANRALLKAQDADGAWQLSSGEYKIGATSLVTLALLSAGMHADDPEIARGLDWLRRQNPVLVKETSLLIQVLVAAGDKQKDGAKVEAFAAQLEELQLREGPNTGSWTYHGKVRPAGGADRANALYAIRGLRDAARWGVPIGPETWHRARAHWLASQNGDGSWSYKGAAGSSIGTGSMTCAGIESLILIQEGIKIAERDPGASKPIENGEASIDKPIENGWRWLGRHFSVTHNPNDNRWILFYLDGLTRAGRARNQATVVDTNGSKLDWYSAGSEYLIRVQNQFAGTWREFAGNRDPIISTSFGILFLANGGARNKTRKIDKVRGLHSTCDEACLLLSGPLSGQRDITARLEPGGDDEEIVIVPNLDDSIVPHFLPEQTERRRGSTPWNFGDVPRLGETAASAWSFRSGNWPAEGLHGENSQSGARHVDAVR
jgi:hypothetical protein